jgi:hypothetical protein
LATQGGVERGHGCADLAGIAAGIGFVQGFGRVDHGAVAGSQRGCRSMALRAFALERFVQRRAEHFPEFLFGLAVQRHGLGFHLPALLQCFDRIHTQSGGSAQFTRFVDQGLTAFDAGFLR